MANILIVGVGGQGTLLASRIIGNAAVKRGFDVKVSEVHGMSQRGGSVITYVRFGEQVSSPIFDEGQADFVLAFEELEALRSVQYVKKGGKMFVNRQCINPMPVITGAAQYPPGIFDKITEKGVELIAADALKLAEEAGNARAVNVVLIGMLAAQMDMPNARITRDEWHEVIRQTVKPQFVETNLKAFESGWCLVKGECK